MGRQADRGAGDEQAAPYLLVRVSRPPVHRRRLPLFVQAAMVWYLAIAAALAAPLVVVFFRLVLATLPLLLLPLLAVYALAQAVAHARLSKLRDALRARLGQLRKGTESAASSVLDDLARCSSNGIHRDIKPLLRVLKKKAGNEHLDVFKVLTDEDWLHVYRKQEPSQMLADYRLHLSKVLFYILLVATVYVTVLCAPYYFGQSWSDTLAAAKEDIRWPNFSLTFRLYFEWPSLLMFQFDLSTRMFFYVGIAFAALTDVIRKWRPIYYATFPSEYRDYASLERLVRGGGEWVWKLVVEDVKRSAAGSPSEIAVLNPVAVARV